MSKDTRLKIYDVSSLLFYYRRRTPKKNEEILLRYHSKNIVLSGRAGSALQKRSLLHKKQKN
jgi:hypothetical protein